MHWPAEAGQVLFDKRGNDGLNLAVLHIANHMMTRPEMYDFLAYGDKDTFVSWEMREMSGQTKLTRGVGWIPDFLQRFAFYALGLPYQQAPRIFASAGGYQTQGGESSPDYFCGHSSGSKLPRELPACTWRARADPVGCLVSFSFCAVIQVSFQLAAISGSFVFPPTN
jgi:hypothetical protein